MIFTSLLSYGLYGKKALYSVDFVIVFFEKNPNINKTDYIFFH